MVQEAEGSRGGTWKQEPWGCCMPARSLSLLLPCVLLALTQPESTCPGNDIGCCRTGHNQGSLSQTCPQQTWSRQLYNWDFFQVIGSFVKLTVNADLRQGLRGGAQCQLLSARLCLLRASPPPSSALCWGPCFQCTPGEHSGSTLYQCCINPQPTASWASFYVNIWQHSEEHKTPEELAENPCPQVISRAAQCRVHSEPASLHWV